MQNYRASWAEAKGAVGPNSTHLNFGSSQGQGGSIPPTLDHGPCHIIASYHGALGPGSSSFKVSIPRGLPGALMIYLH